MHSRAGDNSAPLLFLPSDGGVVVGGEVGDYVKTLGVSGGVLQSGFLRCGINDPVAG